MALLRRYCGWRVANALVLRVFTDGDDSISQ